ncbi:MULTISPECIES: ketopantoate reductase family protein [Leptospira]|uniref:2-dehydropantoate 2-reductase n=1 Tax=Leptospira kirschneri serovar Pomona TaxID=561005 RepID=A0A1T1E5A2_9LEPT|nr:MULTISPECIES: 2-dehydropantoate 2-reductase [Leptospira]EMJ85660.1 2-dehydropantoate 2-reductase [Leptospira kirschneri str. JB]EMK09738.1 2-dehydropantoate 2-reductase [Leptospira kirschneri]KXZ25728.1 2-dehydropantoate 2-reductase [Leptospira kirschneri]KXZ29817.1 2-dehydropantoate 2-reductase [Leptospira sp. ZV016]OOV48278.1 2-dehydropantoate 2-reductase [Leptospira kirschneri serovar Pomona]
MFRILVLGSGAIAGLYAGKLAQAGCKVDFWVRKNSSELKKNGFQIESASWGNFHYKVERVFESVPKNLKDYNLVLNCLKCLPDIDLKKILGETIPQNLPILLLQNGIDIEEPVSILYPENEILSGLAFVCANRTDTGKILHLDYGELTIGSWNRNPSFICDQLVGLFNSVGVPTQNTNTIRQTRWKKLMWNAPFNPISVLCGGKNTSEILDNLFSRKLVIEIMKEVQTLSKLDGAEVPTTQIDAFLQMTEMMKPYKTSMLLDFEAGRPMEIEAILGNTIRIAEKNNLEIPHIQTIYSLLSLYKS